MAKGLTDDANYQAIANAIRVKTGGSDRLKPSEMAGAIYGISGGGSSPTYVVGLPISFTLTGWDPDVQGTTSTLKAVGYKPGAGGIQLGLPSDSSTVNTQAVVAAALTIANATVTAPVNC